ncbi:Capsular polysaccharide biosynthesis protein- like protein [Haloterrigena turkmenica DSM 5511]|uniref:Capsular polysaccharide biosynthesis protein-like protein n=2 Tax=Haloterrigena turkmenica TaxID=62320 RepID=D2RY71_HALTV|nr:Capsular polysaccharide biosynthesis protein- like protein [Haloterrigena turkmenica DSM 5511]
MISTEFASRKLRRKFAADGVRESIVAAGDLLTRKRLGRPVFDPLVEHGVVRTVSRDTLESVASETVTVPGDDEEQSPPFVALIENGRILSETGLVLTPQLEIVEESAAAPDQAQQAMMAMLSRQLFYGDAPLRDLLSGPRPGSTRGAAGSLDIAAPLVPRYPNYYHWIVETVPKIRYIRAFEEATGERVTLLVPPDAPPFVDETLELLEWPESRIEYATAPAYDVSRLVVPSFPERRAEDFGWLRRAVLDSAPETTPKSGDNVYVSRANAVERRVVNEDEVMDVLSRFGFSCYLLEEQSLERNARLFADADIVVGPHGAGLTDIVFADGCTLVELFGDKVKQPYRLLAATLGVSYEPMYCRAESADIVVDTTTLEETLREMQSQ